VDYDRPCLWREGDCIILIDQRELPGKTTLIRVEELEEIKEAINTLAVRGAPAIGAFGALSLSIIIDKGGDPGISYNEIVGTRPTAVDLKHGLDRVMIGYEEGGPKKARKAADDIVSETVESCRRIGEIGVKLLKNDANVMTHCNAGALATLDWGTALAPIRMAERRGSNPFVWVSETRPLLQGGRLTAWELLQEGIGHTVFVDSASGYLMKKGEVDLILVGADRVCRNGDVANKIGTYEKAVLAKEEGIPFYVAIPPTTMDHDIQTGEDIPIEIRDGSEISDFQSVRTVPKGSDCLNPAFDITPAEYVTGFITPRGIIEPTELSSLLSDSA